FMVAGIISSGTEQMAISIGRREFITLLGSAAFALPSNVLAQQKARPADAGQATLNLVLVLDGLRPDSITSDETPNLWRLRQEGVDFPNSHSVFPTVTRVNATAIATGTYPDHNGMLGNRIYVRAVDPN